MGVATAFDGLSRTSRRTLIGGAVLLVMAVAAQSWLVALIAVGLLVSPVRALYTASRAPDADEPWPWPPDFRSLAEGMARPIDPTPRRLLPPDEKSSVVAKVATTGKELSALIADTPPAWPWAVFTSILVQRRNAVQDRLRRCASGYQPRPGRAPLSGRAYAQTVAGAVGVITDQLGQLEQFMVSPAFTGAFGAAENQSDTADADAVVAVAHRLMDYHESFLDQAEVCLQTPVQPEVLTFVRDMGAFALCPLLGYEQFIPTMCARIAQAQDLLPYADAGVTVALDDATLTMTVPDGLGDRIAAHIRRFNSPA